MRALCKQEAAQMQSSFDIQKGDIMTPAYSVTVVYMHADRRML